MGSKVNILVEGQTEETFVNSVLAPYLFQYGIFPVPIIVKTNIEENGTTHKGGFVRYSEIRKQILRLLNDSSADIVTTMMDYYALPKSFPGKDDIQGHNCFEKVRYLERAWSEDIHHKKFFPYLQLHEFESILFTSPLEIATVFSEKQYINRRLEDVRKKFSSPEEINDNPNTNPSSRIIKVAPEYQKVFHGPLIAGRIGLEKIKDECHHFSDWINTLKHFKDKKT
ncbi:MAG: hypothetical protein DRI57_10460 [Deltaproteobacteria bacterium]|nr:MAG: hypothetical protein DRI57_10460 [Deltaproteobacteria bacterium]